jgi:hypothetical protein
MKKKSITANDLFLAILAILLISVSFYQTWLGLDQIFGNASFLISLVLSFLLLFIIWLLRKAKMEGKPTGSLLGIYIFIASFCFIANFNALYTRFMRTDIYTNELRDINEKFNLLEIDIVSKLNYSVKNPKEREAIRSELILLKIQITDFKNPGLGIEARQILNRIEKLLGKKVTPLTPINQSMTGYEDLANRMEDQIVQMIDNLSPEEKNLKNEINNAVLKWNNKIQELLTMSKKDKDDISQGLIDESLTEYNKIGNKALNILGSNKFRFIPVVSKTQDVGKIGFAFEHAIKNFGMYQFVVLMGCVLLDFVIVIIVLLVNTNEQKPGSTIPLSRNGGRTLI